MKCISCLAAFVAMLSLSCVAAERGMADGFAAAGAAQAASGKTEQAKDLLFKALAYDDSCPDALFELAKIMDKENNPMAAAFYQRAAASYENENKPVSVAKRAESEKRLRALDTFAPRLTILVEEYAQDLDKIVKKLPDDATRDGASERINTLGLTNMLAPDKLPKFYTAAAAKGSKTAPDKTSSADVLKELNALGWATVKGSVVKKSTGVYVLTDARLEADKTSGGIDVLVHKAGFDGSVAIAVRSDHTSSGDTPGKGKGDGGGKGKGDDGGKGKGDFSGKGKFIKGNREGVDGYGVLCLSDEFKVYSPEETPQKGEKVRVGSPVLSLTRNWPETQAKTRVQVSVVDIAFDAFINEKRESHTSTGKMSRSGPFVIEVQGTVTLESPRCAGK